MIEIPVRIRVAPLFNKPTKLYLIFPIERSIIRAVQITLRYIIRMLRLFYNLITSIPSIV